MASRANKRKHGKHTTSPYDNPGRALRPEIPLVIQAHEADLVRGPQAASAARSLEVTSFVEEGKIVYKAGDGLIRWGGHAASVHDQSEDEHVHLRIGGAPKEVQDPPKLDDVWVDR